MPYVLLNCYSCLHENSDFLEVCADTYDKEILFEINPSGECVFVSYDNARKIALKILEITNKGEDEKCFSEKVQK